MDVVVDAIAVLAVEAVSAELVAEAGVVVADDAATLTESVPAARSTRAMVPPMAAKPNTLAAPWPARPARRGGSEAPRGGRWLDGVILTTGAVPSAVDGLSKSGSS